MDQFIAPVGQALMVVIEILFNIYEVPDEIRNHKGC